MRGAAIGQAASYAELFRQLSEDLHRLQTLSPGQLLWNFSLHRRQLRVFTS